MSPRREISFVRSLVSYIVVAALTVHTLLGCCAHHAHATSGETHDSCCAGESHEHAHHADAHEHACGSTHHHDEACEPNEAPLAELGLADHDQLPIAPCSGSCEGKCQYVAEGRVQLEKPVADCDFALTHSLPLDAVDASTSRRTDTEPSVAAPLPIRLHLWNRLLLI